MTAVLKQKRDPWYVTSNVVFLVTIADTQHLSSHNFVHCCDGIYFRMSCHTRGSFRCASPVVGVWIFTNHGDLACELLYVCCWRFLLNTVCYADENNFLGYNFMYQGLEEFKVWYIFKDGDWFLCLLKFRIYQ